MRQDIGQEQLSTRNIRARFDETMGRHIERLIGTRYGIDSLPLNVATIPCLILAVERETDIESASSSPPERYTEETFLNELAEFGLNPDEDLKASLQDLIQKGYIDASPDSSFSATKPAISMVRLVDRIFPKMPRANLVAYLVQTMDEVLSGRKELESAISQFDQTLQMQGVPLSKQKTPAKPEQAPAKIFRYRQEQTKSHVDTASPVLRAQDISRRRVQSFFTKKEGPAEDIIGQPGDIGVQKLKESEKTAEPGTKRIAAEDARSIEKSPVTAQAAPEPSPKHETPEQDLPEKTAPVVDEPDRPAVTEEEKTETESCEMQDLPSVDETESGTEPVPEQDEAIVADDIIEKHIAAFSEDLASACPVCRIGKIETKQTAKGKYFYTCSNSDCNLISWGKPHHIVCPQCKNPFLIETDDSAGEITLKCPRATCRYRQDLAGETENAVPARHDAANPSPPAPKPRRKVVRRRVLVRKKR
ncbi:MAG: hypothetical protein QME44_05570 [Thermodesulfobacteriota bacterium]|nr:hypothetical protein [Thermodesulfobacteriota bacterium]